MKRIILFTVILLNLSVIVSAQQQINVQVTNDKQERLNNALVVVLNSANNTLISSIKVDSAGRASIHINPTSEYLKIMAAGYRDYDVRTFPDTDMLHVNLSPLTVGLNEITITASSRVVQKSDRIVFMVTNENLTKGRNTKELLKFTPMLQTDMSDKISIVGKEGVVLYINNRKTQMDADAIHAYLSTLPADRIANIEVITNPGATMRVNGNEGIINLILKKNESNGINGTISVNDKQGRLNSPDGGLYLNYQKDKLNVSANLSATANNMKYSENSDFYFPVSYILQHLETDNKLNNRNLSGIIRADYNLSNKQVLGFAYSVSYLGSDTRRNDITQFGRISEEAIDSVLQSESRAKTPVINQTLNLNYRLKTSSKGNLLLDFYFLNNNRKQTIDNSGNFTEATLFEQYRQHSDEPMSNYSGKAEYTHSFGSGNSLTFGTEINQTNAKSDFFYGKLLNDGNYESDSSKTNSFSYRELYAGMYVSYLRVWNAKFNSRFELIGEYDDSNGVQHVTSEEIARNDFTILPNISLQYQYSPDHRFSYNLSSRMGRPGFYSLNPFRFYLTPTTYKEYNPNLKPVIMYLNTLSYIIKGRYIITLNYMYINQCTNNFLIPVDDRYTKFINSNYGVAQNLGIIFNWNQSFWKNRASMNATLLGAFRKDKGAVETIIIDSKDFYYNLSVNANILLSQKYKWNLTGNFNYMSKTKLAQENLNDSYRFGIGLRKNFKNNISLNFGVQNLLFKFQTSNKVNVNYEYYRSFNPDLRQAYLGLTIPFGNMKAKGANNRNTSSSQVSGRLQE